MKIYCNRFPRFSPWGGGAQFVNAFHKHAKELGHELVAPDSMTVAPDVILLAGLDNDGEGISAEQAIMYRMTVADTKDVKLVLRINENDARKNTTGMDDYLRKLAPHMDGAIFVSQWISDYFKANPGWKCKKNSVIINGVDGDVFKPQPKLSNGKTNIVTAHWSNNVNKGFDIYEKLDEFVGSDEGKNYTFTYIGRDRKTFKNTTVISPLYGKKLGEEMGKYDVYISASRWDPGPNHCVESISCNLPTYVHEQGGGCVEFAGSDHVYRDWEELKQILVKGQFSVNTTQFSNWSNCIQQYVELFSRIIET